MYPYSIPKPDRQCNEVPKISLLSVFLGFLEKGQQSSDRLTDPFYPPPCTGIILIFSPACSWTVYVGSHLQLKHSIREASFSPPRIWCPSSFPGQPDNFFWERWRLEKVEGRKNPRKKAKMQIPELSFTEALSAISSFPKLLLVLAVSRTEPKRWYFDLRVT